VAAVPGRQPAGDAAGPGPPEPAHNAESQARDFRPPLTESESRHHGIPVFKLTGRLSPADSEAHPADGGGGGVTRAPGPAPARRPVTVAAGDAGVTSHGDRDSYYYDSSTGV
jgi:hypothetical protein